MTQERVPYQVGSNMSRQAAESIANHLNRLEGLVYRSIADSGEYGQNCWEVEMETHISRQCSSARLNGLKRKGKIRDSGARRETETGRNAVVYVVTHNVSQEELL